MLSCHPWTDKTFATVVFLVAIMLQKLGERHFFLQGCVVAHIYLHLADYLILNGFNSLWGGRCSWQQKEDKLDWVKKGAYGNKYNAWLLAYRSAIRNKNLTWMGKQCDGIYQENREGRPSGKILSS